MTKDKYVQVLNPKTNRFILINKTKGIIVGVKRDDKPFSNTEIIEVPESKKGLNLILGEEFACGGSISPPLKAVMESTPEFIQPKNKDFRWSGSRYKKDIIQPHIMPDSIAQHVSRVLNQSKTDKVFEVNGSITAYFKNDEIGSMYKDIIEYKEGKIWVKNSCVDVVFRHGEDIYVSDMKISAIKRSNSNEKYTFGDAVKKAMKIEKSLADKAFDKFKEDERKHRTKLKKALERIDAFGNLVTAYDAETPMVIMWELLQKGYIEDVTPAARTGGAVTPDTIYCYKTTSKGRIFIMGYGYP